MNNNEKINWEEVVAEFSSYEGTLKDFCAANNISKNQLYYYRKKFKVKDNIQFHAISMKEEKSQTTLTILPKNQLDVRIEIGEAKIYIPANEIATLTSIIKELSTNV